MSVGFDDFLPNILLEASDCPPEVAEQAVLTTLRDFCKKTRIWQETLDPETLLANIAEYDLTYDDEGLSKVAIVEARLNGIEIPVLSEKQMSKSIKGWRQDVGEQPICVIDLSGDRYRVYPTPNIKLANVLELDVALKPSSDGAVVGDIVLEDYSEAIECGALFRLQKMTNKEWSNPQNAQANHIIYRRGRNNAQNRVAKDFADVSIQLKPRKLSGSV